MNVSAYKISLDINEYGSQAVLKAKQSDTGRKIYISLRSGGTPYTIADNCYAVFTATKTDSSILYNACTIENNEIVYEFTEQTCAAVGRNRCEIKLYGLDDKLITSPRFALLVDGTVCPDGSVASSDEFSALTQMVSDTLAVQMTAGRAAADADEAAGKANAATASANTAAQNASKAASEAMLAAQNANTASVSANEAAGIASAATEAANNAMSNANLAAEKANAAATNVVSIAKNAMAVRKVAGVNLYMDDAVELGFVGCRIFGKTTQNGTPTPEAPAELVSVRDGGSVTVNVTGEGDAQSLTIATPDGLHGNPVTSNGNYTDANGKQWICDEIDFRRGVRIQRVYRGSLSDFNSGGYGEIGSHARTALEIPTAKQSIATPNGMCNIMPMIGSYSADQLHFYAQNRQIWVFVPIDELEERTLAGIQAWLTNKGAEFQYILAAPIETPLFSEELASYAALHTYRNNTTVTNDAEAYMELEYAMDAKKYIDSMIAGTVINATVE